MLMKNGKFKNQDFPSKRDAADFGKSAGEERTQLVLARKITLFRAADNPRQERSLEMRHCEEGRNQV